MMPQWPLQQQQRSIRNGWLYWKWRAIMDTVKTRLWSIKIVKRRPLSSHLCMRRKPFELRRLSGNEALMILDEKTTSDPMGHPRAFPIFLHSECGKRLDQRGSDDSTISFNGKTFCFSNKHFSSIASNSIRHVKIGRRLFETITHLDSSYGWSRAISWTIDIAQVRLFVFSC